MFSLVNNEYEIINDLTYINIYLPIWEQIKNLANPRIWAGISNKCGSYLFIYLRKNSFNFNTNLNDLISNSKFFIQKRISFVNSFLY